MKYILKESEYPSESNWKTIYYETWVKKSYITSLLKPERATKQFLDFSKHKPKWNEVLSKRWLSIGLTKNEIVPPPPLSTRFTHHFSGQIEQKNKLICFMLNPRLDVHLEFEFYRLVYKALFGDDDFEYKVEDPLFYTSFYEELHNNNALQEKAANVFWKDECNRFDEMPRLLKSLADLFDDDPATFFKLGIKSMSDIPKWERYRANLEYAYYLKEGDQFSNDFWKEAHRNLVAIDLVPHPSLGWEAFNEKMYLPYFRQLLESFEIFRTEENKFLFFGAAYRRMFERIQKERSIGKYFPFTVEYINKPPSFKSTTKGVYKIKLKDERNIFSPLDTICVNFRGVGLNDFKILKKSLE